MKSIRPLEEVLKGSFRWNQARIKFLSQFLLALISKESVNLVKVAKAFRGSAQESSNYRRINRFFENVEFDYSLLAKFLVSLFELEVSWVLNLDRTNWKFGRLNINILMLSIAYKGIAIPLFWSFLDKRGNSNWKERIALMERFLKAFPEQRIECLTMDREFIGEKWIAYLSRKGIPFRGRIPKSTLVPNSRHKQCKPVKELFRHLEIGETAYPKDARVIWGTPVYLIVLRTPKDFLIIITEHRPTTAVEDYRRRWEIETLFGCLKSRGFNFEETHLNQTERINKLMALLALAFAWAYLVGVWRNQLKPITCKKHGRPAISLFRYGLDWLISLFFNLTDRKRDFRKVVNFLSST